MDTTNQNTNTNTVTSTVDTTATTATPVTPVVTDTNINVNATATTTATTAMPSFNLDQTVQSLNGKNPSWDLFLVGFFVVGAGLYGLSLGKDRIIAIMVSIYMALAVVAALPAFVLNIKINSSFTLQITAFFAVFVVVFFLLSRQAVLNALSPEGNGKWWQVIIFSFLHVGLLVSVTMSFIPAQFLNKFSPFTIWLFTSEWPHFAWIIAPIVAMIFIGRSKEEK